MSSDAAGILALACYGLAVCGAIWWRTRQRYESWQLGLLMAIAKSYGGLMFQLRVRQPYPLPPVGGLVLVNHRSPVDPLFIVASLRPNPRTGRVRLPEFLTAREYVDLPWPIGFICKHMRAIPVDRDGQDMESAREALRRIEAGRIVGIFPEGRINMGPGLLPPIPGVAWIAIKSGQPVIPAFIHGAPPTTSMIAPFLTPGKVWVHYGPPVDLSKFASRRLSSAMLNEVSEELMRALARTGGYELPRNYMETKFQRVPA